MLDGEEYRRECDNFLIRSNSHEMYLQKVNKSILSIFDDKRCCINESEKIPWK